MYFDLKIRSAHIIAFGNQCLLSLSLSLTTTADLFYKTVDTIHVSFTTWKNEKNYLVCAMTYVNLCVYQVP